LKEADMTSIFPPWDWNRPCPAVILPGGPLGPARAALADSSQIVTTCSEAGTAPISRFSEVEIWDCNGGSDQK